MSIRVHINPTEMWDEDNARFVNTKPLDITIEHCLSSVSEWEAKWEQAFLGRKKKTTEMIIDYIRCMVVDHSVTYEDLIGLTSSENEEALKQIQDYIASRQSATFFQNQRHATGGPRDLPTSEVMYSWMVEYGIDWEAQYWHLNRFLNLVHICNIHEERKQKAENEAYRKAKARSTPRRR